MTQSSLLRLTGLKSKIDLHINTLKIVDSARFLCGAKQRATSGFRKEFYSLCSFDSQSVDTQKITYLKFLQVIYIL